MSMRSSAAFGERLHPGNEIPNAAPMIPGSRDFENYHGSTFGSIQERINKENQLTAQQPPEKRVFRCGDGWYRFEAGKPVRLTDEELKKLGVMRCW